MQQETRAEARVKFFLAGEKQTAGKDPWEILVAVFMKKRELPGTFSATKRWTDPSSGGLGKW